MMYERIEPMPEELAIAHQGRVAHFIGVQNDQAFNMWLKKKMAQEAIEFVHMSRLTQLSVISGMSATEYARLHSMLGVLRFAAQPNCLGHHGALEGETFSKRMGMCIQKREAYLCPTCVKEDLERWKFSWFRRTHHLMGVDWCPSHRTPLAKVKSREPWSKLPQHWVERGDIENDVHFNGYLEPNSFEFRFCEIARSQLSSNGPVDAGKLRQLLRARAHQLGLRISRSGQRLLVSDYVARVAGVPWLEQHWPEVLQKTQGTYLNSLDKSLSNGTCTGTGFAYTTILAAMWESPEQVNDLIKPLDRAASALEKREKKIWNNRGQSYWHGEIWEAYVANHGNAISMAEVLGQDRTTLSKKMMQIGLPTLRSVTTSPVWRAYLKFEAGMALSEACTLENADSNEVEALIRVSCARVASAAKTVIKSRMKRSESGQKKTRIHSSKSHQIKPVSPPADCELTWAVRLA